MKQLLDCSPFIGFALGVKLNGVSKSWEIFAPSLNYKLIKLIDLS